MKRQRWKKWITLAAVAGMLVGQIGAIPVWAEEEQIAEAERDISEAVMESETTEITVTETTDAAAESEERITEQKEETESAENYGTVSGNDEVPEDNNTLPEDDAGLPENDAALPDDGTALVTTEDRSATETGSGTYIPYEGAKYSLEYSVTDDGVSIDGISDYASIDDLGQLVIPEEIDGVAVTTIGEDAFYYSSGFTGDLIIPNSVTTIGEYAFFGCSGFTGKLVISDSMTIIGERAFSRCSGFTGGLVIPDSVTTIGEYAFWDCSGFTGDLIIPNSVTTIGTFAFYGCSGFTGNLVIPNSVTTIGEYAFFGCSGFTGDLVIPSCVKTIGQSVFSHCNFENLIIGMKNIPQHAFDACNFEGTLTLMEGVETIGEYAFSSNNGYGYNSFTGGDLIIPDSVTTIGECAFIYCGFTGNLVIPNSVDTIEEEAFYGCNFQELIIGMKNIPQHAFDYCNIEGTITLMEGVETIGEYAFWECNHFTGDLIIPDSVTTIGKYAFWGCSGFKGDLVIPSSVKTIGRFAFKDCSFENLIIGMKDIPDRLFDGEYTGETDIYGAFEGCAFSGTLTLLESVETIGNSSFEDCDLFKGDLIIPDGVVSIGRYAFAGCNNLFVKIPDSVQQIGAYAFASRSRPGISKITIYGTTTEIESGGLGEQKFIYGYSGSTAEIYAKKFCTFIPLDDTPEVTEYRVSNTQELLDAIGSYGEGSYRHIILEDGIYELSSRIYLSQLVSLTLEAENPGKVEILSSNRNVPVIIINGCTDIEIIGCILGHDAVEPGSCGTNGYVVKLENSFNVNFEKCDLYGCGVEGVYCTSVSDIKLNSCVIRDCMERIASGSNVDGLSFTNCIISGNAYDEFSAENYAALSFSGNVSMENCVFMNNYNTKFGSADSGYISAENCTYYNNAWDGETPGAYGICLNGITWQVDGNVLKIGYPLVLGDTTIASETGTVLPYSDSALPWKDYQDLEVNVAKGVTYGSPVEDKPAPGAVRFPVVGVIGGRNVTFSTDTEDAVIYYSSKTSSLTTEDACVQNGETVLFEDFYGTIYARAYANGQWGNVSRLILKIPVVSRPVITSNNGMVTIKTSTPNSTIYYTTDGSTPSPTNGKRLTGSAGSFTVPANCTVKAIAVRSCFTNSEIASAAVTAKKLGAPSFAVKGVIGGRAVTFNSAEAQGEIYYSFTTSNITTKDLHVKSGETVLFENYYGTVYARTYVNGQWSNVSRLILKIPVVNKPTITAAGNGKVKITTTTPNCTIYYTTDGSTPSPTHGTRINSSSSVITVGSGKTIKAIAVRSCFTNSDVATYK